MSSRTPGPGFESTRCAQTPFRRSLNPHSTPAAAAALPRSLRAPSLRFGPKRSRALVNASFTKLRLPITAPSVK